MKLKILFEDQYVVSAIMNGDTCPVEDSLLEGNPVYESSCNGLLDVIARVAESGLQQLSSKQSHWINEDPKIYELIRGRLRLIYFHGLGNAIVISTEVVLKKSRKVDRKVVNRALKAREAYFESIDNNTLIEIRDHENKNE